MEKERAEEEAHWASLEEEFYAGVPEEERNYGVTPGLKHYMMRENLGYALLLDIINDPDAEYGTSHNNGYEVPRVHQPKNWGTGWCSPTTARPLCRYGKLTMGWSANTHWLRQLSNI